MPVHCHCCGAASQPHATAQILSKYSIQYYCCTCCGFIQTEEPYWLGESYSDAILASDVGLVKRNLELAPLTGRVINAFFNPQATFVDYGGGYGMLVRMLRDRGYDFRWQDKYATNLMARGFEAKAGEKYELLTAFEVFEHLPNPQQELVDMLKWSENLLFSTVLVPQPAPQPPDWWYYGLNHGQHVALFTPAALKALGQKHGLNYYTNGKNLHLFTRKRIPGAWFALLTSRLGPWLGRGRRDSLQQQDFDYLREAYGS